MCSEITKIKICHRCFLIFLIPSASFLQPSWISTVTFHLRITSRVFTSTHSRPVQDEYHVSWVYMAGPNCLCVTTLRPRHIHVTYMATRQCRIMYSYYTTSSTIFTIQCQLNKKPLMYQQLIIVYLIVIICSQ